MNLVERFNQFLWRKDAAEVAAEEVQRLAIAYSRYYFDEALKLGRDILPDDTINVDIFLFNNFITEFYGKIEGQV